ncbi:MAG: efflux RND transporter permease subunit, partial [Coraliomargarita sp.]
MFSLFFIKRPIFAAVISIVIVVLGLVSLVSLPIARYPDLAPPTINVSAVYPGADALTVADTVAATIEKEVNGV